jgi:pimeloyl-ACP methyl ester carboxylesterase
MERSEDPSGARSRPSPLRDIVGKTHWVENGEVRLHVWEKYQESSAGKPVVVLAHGSTTAGLESFDLQVPGKPSYSLMDTLAKEGFDVFAPDIRGFGRSTRPEGHMNTREAAEDLNVVVTDILVRRQAARVNLLGWSWGTQYGGMFVMAHPDKVSRYVSYAQMHVNSPDIALRRSRISLLRRTPYVAIPERDWASRFTSMTPDSVNDPVVVKAFAMAAAQVETRTPTGPQIDMVSHLPMVDARLVAVPTMIVHGEFDDVADPGGLFPFFHQLPNPDKRYVIIPRAGHMMHLQQGHGRFQREVSHFFREGER